MIQIIPVRKLPLVNEGDSVADLIVKATKEERLTIQDRDILIVAQKVVSKAEGGIIHLKSVTASPMADEIAKASGKDPRHVQVILNQSRKIVRKKDAHLIVETKHGFVCANAGVDRSNVEDPDTVAILPTDPDKSARLIRERVRELTGADVAVVISDTFGRAWRIGQVNVAIGADVLKPIVDYR